MTKKSVIGFTILPNISSLSQYGPMNVKDHQDSHETPTTSFLTQLVYTPHEIEILLQLSKNTVNAMLNSGKLRAVRCGRKWLIPRDALMEFLTPEAAQ